MNTPLGFLPGDVLIIPGIIPGIIPTSPASPSVPSRPPASAQGGSDGHEARPGRHRAKEVRGGETTLRSGQQGANMGMGCRMSGGRMAGDLSTSQLWEIINMPLAFGFDFGSNLDRACFQVFHYPNQCGDVHVLSCRDITVN